MKPETATTLRRLSISARLMAIFALALLPFGVVAMMMAAAPPQDMPAMALETGLWAAALAVGWLAIHQIIVVPLLRLQALVALSDQDAQAARAMLDSKVFHSPEMESLATQVVALSEKVRAHEQELSLSLAEQRQLTREIHHRVKNSLQVISSLLSLHARGEASPDVARTYAAMQARVSALNMVHRWIYDDESVAGVNLQALVADLCGGLEASLTSPTHSEISIDSQGVEPIIISADAAVPVAFLLTELASIAVHQGAPGSLVLRIEAQRRQHQLTVAVEAAAFLGADWLVDNAAMPSARVITGMSRQLHSKVWHDAARGRYALTFADPQP